MAAGKLFMPQRMSTSSLACILHLLNLWLLIIIKKKKRHEFWKDGMGEKEDLEGSSSEQKWKIYFI